MKVQHQPQHLADEAVAACADGVLRGTAAERAARHIDECAECRTAVRVQREAAYALRAAPAPALPADLAARLRSVPMTTPITTLPTVIAPDGTTMLVTFAAAAPAAALVAPEPARGARRIGLPFAAGAAVAALAGVLVAGSVGGDDASPARTGTGVVVRDVPAGGPVPAGPLLTVFRADRP